jgi:predicted permease
MRLLDALRFRFAVLFHRSRMNSEIENELRSHVELCADDLERSGLSRQEAERLARIELGGQARFAEASREAVGIQFVETLFRDIRFGTRMLRKAPGFAAIVIITLALAIGANALVFGVLNALVLRPLDLPHPEYLYSIARNGTLAMSYPDYLDLRDQNRTFDGLAAYTSTQVGLDSDGNPSRAFADEVTGNYFDVLGAQPYLGRFFHSSDEHGPDSAPYIVLSYSYWRSHFQADPAVIGHTVQLNKRPFTMIGVAPPGFHGPVLFFTQDFFVPLVNQAQLEGQSNLAARGTQSILMSVGRLKVGTTPEQTIKDLNLVGLYLERNYPKTDDKMRFTLSRPELFGDFGGPPTRAFLTALMILAALVLLAACANLGSLVAARTADRSREIALRLALGAGRWRILRQLLAEGLLLSLVGGSAGLSISVVLLRWLSAWQPIPKIPFRVVVSPDARVYVSALLLSLLSGILFGSIPLRQVFRTDPYAMVKGKSPSAHGRRITIREFLLALQIAICALLITCSIVAARGYFRSLNDNLGFEPHSAVLMDTDLTMADYRADQMPAMQRRILDSLRAIPGVGAAGFANLTPLNGTFRGSNVFSNSAADLRAANASANVATYDVSPGYFAAADTRLLAGRDFSWRDDPSVARVAVVNEKFARTVFRSGDSALGRFFKMQDGTRVQVVGLVEDGKYERIGENPRPAMFLSILQYPSSQTTLVLRSNRDPEQLALALRGTVHDLDSGLPVFIQTWNDGLAISLFPDRMATIALTVLGVMGAMLSLTGIFGVAAYSVSTRLKELGIRMALGAQPAEVLRTALARPLRLLVFGSAAGLLIGIAASRMIASIVFQPTPPDPMVMVTVVACMSFLGVVAAWIPARRALSLHPLALLREE